MTDRTQMPRPPVQQPQGATNATSPDSGGDGGPEEALRATLADLISRALDADEDVHADAEMDLVSECLSIIAEATARAVLDVGWRPPVRVQWGCRTAGGEVFGPYELRSSARRIMGSCPGSELVQRPAEHVWTAVAE